MFTKRHTEGLPQGTVREGAGLQWTLITDQFGEVWEAGAKAWKVRYNKAYCDGMFSVADVGCKTWDRATAYAVRRATHEYEQAKRIVAVYEGAE